MGFVQFVLGHLPAPDVTGILVVGVVMFAASLVMRRRVVELPVGRRRAGLAAVGVAGGAIVLIAATASSALAASLPAVDGSGYSGWWIRPLALGATLLVLIAILLMVLREKRPAPGSRALLPPRVWHDAAPRAV